MTHEGEGDPAAEQQRRVLELEGVERRLAAAEAELLVLRASEVELRAMFRAMTDVVLVMSAEGRYLKVAPTSPDLLYRPSEELVGKLMQEVMPAENAAFFLSHVREAIEARRVVTMDYSLPIEGREVWFTCNISPIEGDMAVLVARDVSDRKRVEQALAESVRQQRVIEAQEAALAEMSTPLIPISDDIVVIPLIGLLDSRRMQQIMETLLRGVTDRGARVAILDVTGLALVDSKVADALLRAARAVELLGARVILTGMRPDVARTLVHLDADLGGIVTRGTLQNGIAFAMATLR